MIINAEGSLVINVGEDFVLNVNGHKWDRHASPPSLPGFGG
jgi:hypothetical protein